MSIVYPYLPEGREISYVPADHACMQAAKEMSEHAADKLHPTGAVIVKDGKIIGRGCNYAFIGIFPFLTRTHPQWCVRRMFKIPSGQKYWACPGCIPSKNHAEGRAVRDAKSNGYDPHGADLYLWGHWWCCKPCWDAMIGVGIENVYLAEGSEQLFDTNHPKNIIGKQCTMEPKLLANDN